MTQENRFLRWFYLGILYLFFLRICTLATDARSAAAGEAWNLYLENDSGLLGGPGTDDNYTSGIKVSYLYGTKKKPRWSPFYLDIFKHKDSQLVQNFGLALGHQIYTPEDIGDKMLNKADRPYAAWGYLSFSTSFAGEKSVFLWDMSLGLVGPHAGGESIQKFVHKVTDADTPRGWSHQLKDELTAQLFFQHRYALERLSAHDHDYLELVVFYGAALGNVYIHADAGYMLRIGYDLPRDFGPSRPSSSDVESVVTPSNIEKRTFSFNLFSGGRGIGSAYNLFLDGNSYIDSHRVNRIPLFIEFELGFTLGYGPFELTWRRIIRSAEFTQKEKNHSFVSINLSIKQDL